MLLEGGTNWVARTWNYLYCHLDGFLCGISTFWLLLVTLTTLNSSYWCFSHFPPLPASLLTPLATLLPSHLAHCYTGLKLVSKALKFSHQQVSGKPEMTEKPGTAGTSLFLQFDVSHHFIQALQCLRT